MNKSAFILLLTIPACVPGPGVVSGTVQEEVVIVMEQPEGTPKGPPLSTGKTYGYTDTDQQLEQILTITYADKEQQLLAFKLETTSEGCRFSITGDAKLKPLAAESEVDEDDQGNAYEVREYLAETENFSLEIRLAYDEEDVRIKYTPITLKKGHCAPASGVLMVLK